VNALALKK